jgi:hypothetical protein
MILFFSILSNLILQIYTVALAQKDNPWVYLTVEEHEALLWLQQNAFGRTVLAPLILATMVPANSPNRVHLAYQDARFDKEAREWVEDFYQGRLESQQGFLRESRVDYVVVDVDESNWGETDYLEEVYENEKVKIFKVR